MISEEQARQHIRELLEYIGEDPDRPGLKDTPDRMIRMFGEMFRGYDPAQAPVVTTFPNGLDGIIYDDMVVDTGPFYSVCEHHCRTFFGEYWFAYLPNPKGRILGLSKIGRVVDYCAARLQVQERLDLPGTFTTTRPSGSMYGLRGSPFGVTFLKSPRRRSRSSARTAASMFV